MQARVSANRAGDDSVRFFFLFFFFFCRIEGPPGEAYDPPPRHHVVADAVDGRRDAAYTSLAAAGELDDCGPSAAVVGSAGDIGPLEARRDERRAPAASPAELRTSDSLPRRRVSRRAPGRCSSPISMRRRPDRKHEASGQYDLGRSDALTSVAPATSTGSRCHIHTTRRHRARQRVPRHLRTHASSERPRARPHPPRHHPKKKKPPQATTQKRKLPKNSTSPPTTGVSSTRPRSGFVVFFVLICFFFFFFFFFFSLFFFFRGPQRAER